LTGQFLRKVSISSDFKVASVSSSVAHEEVTVVADTASGMAKAHENIDKAQAARSIWLRILREGSLIGRIGRLK
jgi:hypothetical protein